MAELRRQLEYQSAWYGTRLVVADPWFASSKTCTGCGHVHGALTLADRVFTCPACALELDRDVNAAVNLARLALIDAAPPLCRVTQKWDTPSRPMTW